MSAREGGAGCTQRCVSRGRGAPRAASPSESCGSIDFPRVTIHRLYSVFQNTLPGVNALVCLVLLGVRVSRRRVLCHVDCLPGVLAGSGA